MWSIHPRLEVLPLTQKYQTEQKDFDPKMPDRRLHVYSAQITFLQLNQVTLQPEFNLNPITYGILTFRQLQGWGGLFGPDPENKVIVNRLIWNLVLIMVWMILVNMQNFKLMTFLLLEIWRHKNFLSIIERVIAIRYLPSGFMQNSTKITFYAWKHFFWLKVIPPLHFHCFQAKTKIS